MSLGLRGTLYNIALCLLALWFVVFGVNVKRWNEQASAALGRQ